MTKACGLTAAAGIQSPFTHRPMSVGRLANGSDPGHPTGGAGFTGGGALPDGGVALVIDVTFSNSYPCLADTGFG